MTGPLNDTICAIATLVGAMRSTIVARSEIG